MTHIADNIRRIRKLKNLSQKQVALSVDIAQSQYSLIENGKVMPTIPSLIKIATVFEVSLSELVREHTEDDQQINLSILEKIKLIDTLDEHEKDCLLTMIDIAISKKQMKDKLAELLAA